MSEIIRTEFPTSESSRAGASASLGSSTIMEAFDPDQFDRDDLPMLVWLRGDEEICSEFTMDAESVMEELGIKRSRLTQIAGKELRVGRMRVGRYVRPVFRELDVQAYKGWVRASASHLKSSRAIEDAAAKLEFETSNLADKVKDAASAELEALNGKMLYLHQTSQRLFVEFADGVTTSLEKSKASEERADFSRTQRERELINSISEFVQQTQAQNSLIHTALAGLAGAIQSQRIELQDLKKLSATIIASIDEQNQKKQADMLPANSRVRRTVRRDAVKLRQLPGTPKAQSKKAKPAQFTRGFRRATTR